MSLSNVNFIISAPNKKSWPLDNIGEVCFLGKSNVGKSSFLNALANSKKMARVSSMPGCTKLLNFFDVNGRYRIVDAPGYGYAKTSVMDDKSFSKMMSEYIYERENVKLFVLLLDSRHTPTIDDIDCYEMLKSTGKDIIVVATKADKLNQSMKSKFKKNIKERFKNEKIDVFLVSSLNKENIDFVQETIENRVEVKV